MTPPPEQRAEGCNRVEYCKDGALDEVVTDAGMHLERLSRNEWFLSGTRSDGTSIGIWLEGEIKMVEERPAPRVRSGADALAFREPPASADPHGNPATRWERGLDGSEWTIVPLWDGKPEWLRDDDDVKLRQESDWRHACTVSAHEWFDRPAFFLRRRPQVDKALVALIYDAAAGSSGPMDEARNIARALVAEGWRKDEG